MFYNFYHHPLDSHARPGLCQTPGNALMRKERDMVTVCLSGSYGWGFEIGHRDGKHQMGAQRVGEEHGYLILQGHFALGALGTSTS